MDKAPELCRLIERCLQRDPKMRLRDIGEARIFLQDGGANNSLLNFSHSSMVGAPSAIAAPKQSLLPLLAVALLCVLAGTFLGMKVLARQEPAPVLHVMIPPPNNTDYDLNGTAPGPAALSPDGTQLAFTASDADGITRLYLRQLDKGESVALSGTEGAAYPFWSPTSEFIGYFEPAGHKLKKIAVGGGPPVTLCTAENGKGGAWNSKDEIIFAPDFDSAIHLVPAIGGDPVPITKTGSEYQSHRHPRFLPNGEEYIFIGRGTETEDLRDVFLASIDTSVTPRIITQSQINAEYSNGHLLSVREGVLMATPFTTDQEKLLEGGTPLVENILSIPGAAVGVFSPSNTGMLVYQTGVADQGGQMVFWTSKEFAVSDPLGEPDKIFHPFISPDGNYALVEVHGASNEGNLLFDFEREDNQIEIHKMSIEDASAEIITLAFAPEGNLGGGEYSPDGRWIAYHTESVSGWDVFVIPAKGGPRKWQITTEGAVYPNWNSEGTELWISTFSGRIHAYAVDGTGQTFRAGTFRDAFTITTPGADGCFYDLHPDGLRILQTGMDPAFRSEISFLHLVTDWQRGLGQ